MNNATRDNKVRVGSLTDQERTIINFLSTEERKQALLDAGKRKLVSLTEERRVKLMIWNHNRNAYQAQTDDGKTMLVDGDVFAEERARVLRAEIADLTPGWDQMNGEQRQDLVDLAINDNAPFAGLYDKVDKLLLNPIEWSEEMDGVTIEAKISYQI